MTLFTARAVRFAALIFLTAGSAAHAACPTEADVSAYLEDMKAKRENLKFTTDLSRPEAECARKKLMAALPAVLGPQVGYRATFTNPHIRGLLHLEEPVWGAMYGKELLASPARVSHKYGAVTYWDPDLLLVLKDAKLADATTPLEALASVSAVIPYIGLKDNMLNDNESFEHFVAVNGGFRGGVLGKRIPVTLNKRFVDALANMEVITSRDGKVISKARGKVLMDSHPLDAAIWLARTLRQNGIELKPGDLLAVGGFSFAEFPRAGNAVSVKYAGLPGNPKVDVTFD